MARTLTDDDIDAIVSRLVQVLAVRLADPGRTKTEQSPAPRQVEPAPRPQPKKIAYTLAELSAELGVSKVSIYRLESRGLLKSLPYLRTKIYSYAEVEKFLRGHAGERLKAER